MNKRIETLAKEIKTLHTISFDTIVEVGKRIQEAQTIVEGEEFQEFCNMIGISKGDCSRYVNVFEHKEIFDQFPQLKELGTGKIFSLLSIIKEGKIEEFINQYGVNTSMAQMKKNIKAFRNGGETDQETDEETELEKLKAEIERLKQENNLLQREVQTLKRRNTGSTGKLDKTTSRKILSFIHPDRYMKFGDEVVKPMTEASKIINGLAG
jgi:hypothetical protein